jgi:hypothetical protein
MIIIGKSFDRLIDGQIRIETSVKNVFLVFEGIVNDTNILLNEKTNKLENISIQFEYNNEQLLYTLRNLREELRLFDEMRVGFGRDMRLNQVRLYFF